MNCQDHEKQNRREWLRTLTRGAALVGLSVMGVLATTKNRRLPPQEKCTNHYLCRNCAVLKRCGLPQALSVKLAPDVKSGGIF